MMRKRRTLHASLSLTFTYPNQLGSVSIGESHQSQSAKASFVVQQHAIVRIFEELKKTEDTMDSTSVSDTFADRGDEECVRDAIGTPRTPLKSEATHWELEARRHLACRSGHEMVQIS